MSPAYLILATTLSLLFVGCGKAGHRGVGMGSHTWSNSASDPTPGLDEGSIEVITLTYGEPGGVKLLLWCDSQSGRSSGSGGLHEASAKGSFVSQGQTVATYACVSKDGVTATIEIDGKTYQTQDGNVLLISTQTGKPVVKQLKIDLPQTVVASPALPKLADEHPEIKEFFTTAKPTAAEASVATPLESKQ